MDCPFIHLKVHSEYSMVDGIVRIDDLVAEAAAMGMPAVALTDQMNLFALVKFYRKAIKAGIKPIIGADVFIADDDAYYRATLLCKNQQGYHHLACLLSKAYLEGQQTGQPLLAWEWLVEMSADLIVLSGAKAGDIGQALLQKNQAKAQSCLARWLSTFPQHFYLELTRDGQARQDEYLKAVLALAEENQVPVVASNSVCFLKQDDFEAHEARVCIGSGYVLNDSKRPRNYTEQQYLKTPEEMAELFADIPEALSNSIEIAKRCNVELRLNEVFLPKFPIPEGSTEEDYFALEAQNGLAEILANMPDLPQDKQQIYYDRLDNELNVINKMGFPGYFLIVADFIGWAKAHNIPVGPGRGSGAGSLVAYALGITTLDPIIHELLFERFLNPERISMPDFDVDFCMEGRDRVIEYVATRYGHDAVAQIITYGTMAAKAVVRDVGRVLGLPYGFVDKIAKLIPFELGMTLGKALVQEELLAERYRTEDEVQGLIDLAKKLEGITRNAGKHAGGVVIAPTTLTDFAPLFCEAGGEHVVTQFDKDDVEAIGLVKFDFLGLRTLTIIDWALQHINAKRQEQNESAIDIDAIPLDDKKSFDLLKSCATTAVFQLESRGMKDLIRRLQPDSFDDITALVALFRPGPLQSGMVDDFIDRKHGRAKVHYPHPDLANILRPTYGVILYQEQVMQIAQVLAGYSLGGADILRRAMGKKKPEEMAKQRAVFLAGAQKRGIDTQVAQHIFDLMEKFAGYGFNKSHSAAYALIAYQTAWLKAHYPAEFMAAVLSSDMDNTDKVAAFFAECQSMGLTVLPPNINQGQFRFTVNQQGEIIYGLGAIKGVGESVIVNLVAEREKSGPYQGLFDLCERLDTQKINRRALEPLVCAGALDEFKIKRATLFASVDKALKSADQKHRDQLAGQNDLFAASTTNTQVVPASEYMTARAWTSLERLQAEKATLGIYLSGHPLQEYMPELKPIVKSNIAALSMRRQETTIIAGIVLNTRVITTRSGKRMAVIVLEDLTGRVDVTLFSEVYQQAAPMLAEHSIFIVKGEVNDDDFTGGIRLNAEAIMSLNQVREQMAKRLVIKVNNKTQATQLLDQLPKIIGHEERGRCPITVAYHNDKAHAELELGDAWRIKPTDALLNKLYHICGDEQVNLEYHRAV